MPDGATSSPILQLDGALPREELKKIRDNLSAIVVDRDHLWLGGDEGTSIHRMTRDPVGNFGSHTSFDLKETLRLPGPAKEEIDIEGLDVDGGYLWLIGSHSAKRKKADEATVEANLQRLSHLALEGNRFTLARVPLDPEARPVPEHAGLTAARLKGDTHANVLTEALQKDQHVGRFVPHLLPNGVIEGVPSKDNGFDVEGLAVSGNRVFLGLRGPVLRGWAIVIELQVKAGSDGTLTLDTLGASGEPYRKHFLQLDGLGVRDLVIDGGDLLILAGPSMDLDGPVFIYRWKSGLSQSAHSLTLNKDLVRLVEVPFGVTTDHAEGLSLLAGPPLSLLVCYDSPSSSRIVGADRTGVRADIFAIASAVPGRSVTSPPVP